MSHYDSKQCPCGYVVCCPCYPCPSCVLWSCMCLGAFSVDWPLVAGSFSAVVLFIIAVALFVYMVQRKGARKGYMCQGAVSKTHVFGFIYGCDSSEIISFFFSFTLQSSFRFRQCGDSLMRRRKGIVSICRLYTHTCCLLLFIDMVSHCSAPTDISKGSIRLM